MDKAGADPLVGRTVAQYDIVARLGGGGMGVVYAARDTRLGRRVALKFLPPQWSHDESAKQRFIREAQAASATDHRNICTVHDIQTAPDGQLFIVMAHYEGQTLKERLEAGTALAVDEAIEIAAQVAEGLAKAHAQGVIHRDIKPGNLMLTEDGVKILDFGLAKFADARLKLTLEGSTIGTVAYMSPEQTRGEEADARSDVWAAGVVLYEMLAGAPPFKGGYPEAIAHAIKNEPPLPLRARRQEIPEALEQIVFRALHKNPNVRFQTARDLARALRQLQGRTVPLDLRTEPVPAVDATLAPRRPRHSWAGRKALAAAAALAVLLVGAPLWVLAPVERIPVAVAPVVNQTGYAELDPYRLALTQELSAQLAASRLIRVLPHDRLLQIVRRFRQEGGDVSSREAMQAIATHGGVRFIIVPTLLHENGGWKARLEFRTVDTATNEGTYETDSVVSSLIKDTAYALMAQVATGAETHFASVAPRRARVAALIRSAAGRTAGSPTARMRTLDAAAAFEQGLDAYEQQEHSAAFTAFAAAAELDLRNPLSLAWKSRAARMMRRDADMTEAAQAAARLVIEETAPADRLFVEAVAAEARRDFGTAEARSRALEARASDEPAWILELAGLQDRQGRPADAIATYHRALALDERLPRAHLELCRLYNPNELTTARHHGVQALTAYRALGAKAGEAQALWCLSDVLRLGSADEVRQARQHADAALAILKALGSPYNLSRAYNYVALAAAAQGRMTEAVGFWDTALTAARDVRNEALQPLVLMNLGVAHVRLGNRARAVAYYEQSSRGFEALGLEQRAAEIQANAASIRIENGDNPDQGLRDVQNALAVSRKLGNRNFEVLAAQLTAAYYRYAGRHAEAERQLNRALSLAKERDLKDDLASVTTDIARSRLDTGDYEAARTLLVQAVASGSGAPVTHARMRLGQTYVRLGNFVAARSTLTEAEGELKNGADPELLPLLYSVRGELAYESGRLPDARRSFEEAAAFWTDTLPDAASVEARAYLGMMDALEGRISAARPRLQASVDQARRMGRAVLAARCRLFLARLEVEQRRFDQALEALDGIPPDDSARTIGLELRAQAHYWRSRALAGRGALAGAQSEHAAARQLVERLGAQLAEADRVPFTARPDIRRIIG